jgi:hypothetical protein
MRMVLHGSGTNGLEWLDIKSDFTVEVDFSKSSAIASHWS